MALEGIGVKADSSHGTGERAAPPQCTVVKYLAVPTGADFQVLFFVCLE